MQRNLSSAPKGRSRCVAPYLATLTRPHQRPAKDLSNPHERLQKMTSKQTACIVNQQDSGPVWHTYSNGIRLNKVERRVMIKLVPPSPFVVETVVQGLN